ncbi:MAG: GtrA family protein [Candidatus Accumulibacter sp.]|jgi:putative flippase GtrA|nr:GtrA family protein [Accumulibacter sp.]
MKLLARFANFLLVGGLATLVQYALLVALVKTGLFDAVTASSIGFVVSALLNYALNRRFTFRSRREHAVALPRFAAVAAGGLALNAFLMWLTCTKLGLHYLLGQIIATCCTLAWNFCLHQLWTFSDGRDANHP